MGTQRTRLLCNTPTAVLPPALAPRESRLGHRAGLEGGSLWHQASGGMRGAERVAGAGRGRHGHPRIAGPGQRCGGLTRQEHWRQGLELDRKLAPSS